MLCTSIKIQTNILHYVIFEKNSTASEFVFFQDIFQMIRGNFFKFPEKALIIYVSCFNLLLHIDTV